MQYYDPGDTPAKNPYASPSPSPSPAPTPTAGTPGAPPPPPAPPGTVNVTGSGYTPNYGNLIENDPAYLAAKAAADLAQRNAGARRKQALQQAIIQYGGLPSDFTDQYGDIDQATLDQAGHNQNSTLAQLANNYAKSGEQFRRSLAARGALQSGDLNYGQDQLDQAYAQQRYDAANAVGSGVNSALNDYLGVLSGNSQSLAGAIQGAESNVYSNPAYRPSEPTSANYDAGLSAQYGQPIYVDSSGNQYDSNGNPFAAPSASPAAPSAPSTNGGTSPYLDYFAPQPAPSNQWLGGGYSIYGG